MAINIFQNARLITSALRVKIVQQEIKCFKKERKRAIMFELTNILKHLQLQSLDTRHLQSKTKYSRFTRKLFISLNQFKVLKNGYQIRCIRKNVAAPYKQYLLPNNKHIQQSLESTIYCVKARCLRFFSRKMHKRYIFLH